MVSAHHNLLSELNKRLTTIRSDISANRRIQQHPEPGLTFFAPCLIDGKQDAILLVVLSKQADGIWLCCKLSLETEEAGPFDLILHSKDWSGKYVVIIESWNTVYLHENDIGSEYTNVIPQEWLSRALMLYNAFKEGQPSPSELHEFCGSEMEFIDPRTEFQEREAEIVTKIIRKNKSTRFSVIIGGKSKIGQKFSIDKRVGFDFPYQMALKSPNGQVVPVQNISPASGEWDVIQSNEENPRFNCLVHSGIITLSEVKETEFERIEWVEINKKVFIALSVSNVKDKIASLEKVFRSSGEDPYAAFNLAWILFFEKENQTAMEYLNKALTSFPLLEFKTLANKAQQIFQSDSLKDMTSGKEPMADVWRIRCYESNPNHRISHMKELYLKTLSGYIAYEIAVEYQYLGSYDHDNFSYEYYKHIREWAERSLSATEPLEPKFRPWPEQMFRRIAQCVSSIPNHVSSDPPRFYIPIHKAI